MIARLIMLCAPLAVLPAAAQTFTVSPSGFTAPNGQPWTMRGLNAGVQDALQGFPGAMQQFPGMTAIRLNTGGNDSTADIAKVVQEYTGKGVVVEIEDHTGSPNNIAWYQQMASTFKGNPLVMLETPNEPNPNGLAQTQIGIIQAIRATGFANPIGVQPGGGFDQSNIPAVVEALGTKQLFVTPHIYDSSTNPNDAAQYVQSEIGTAKANGLFASIDEFGNAMDGVTMNPQGDSVIAAVIKANSDGQAGGIAWAMDNGNHPDGADSACLDTACTQLTPMGQELQVWLFGQGIPSDLSVPATTASSSMVPINDLGPALSMGNAPSTTAPLPDAPAIPAQVSAAVSEVAAVAPAVPVQTTQTATTPPPALVQPQFPPPPPPPPQAAPPPEPAQPVPSDFATLSTALASALRSNAAILAQQTQDETEITDLQQQLDALTAADPTVQAQPVEPQQPPKKHHHWHRRPLEWVPEGDAS
jgi:Cellulase (glycosyl hydrolase family 5)